VKITDVKFTSARTEEVETGLLGFLAIEVDDALRLDNLTLRRTADGRLTVSFPARRDGRGRRRFYICPLNDRARREIEHQVLEALGFLEEVRR
jgi:DNA-binding cell septation regulator SpoVG